ncbi:potassium channel family protein [uncultured Methylovirgula sp.]|uniref:potassium channel family protein n=1 Tax=uncultured Methylovirgula sp. TaxID=1285960 RepID=UPI0026335CC7|nr:potassium channel family protein [uncultured Methylovirgula sp.]
MSRESFRRLQERLGDPLLTALTVMMMLLLFVTGPLEASGVTAAHFFGILFACVLVAAVFFVSGSPLALAGTGIALVLSIVTSSLRAHHPSIVDVYLEASGWLVAGMTLFVVVARAVFAPGRITFHRIVGSILLYLDVGLIFAALYGLVALTAHHGAFSGLPPLNDDPSVGSNVIYFSFVTLTSVGYGDIAPVHPIARALANIEAIIGQLYPATLLARLVTLELAHRNNG